MGHTLPGVLLGVLDELSDTLAGLPGDNPADVLDELAFLCHLAMGAFVMGMSSFKMLWMSFSNPNCAILFRFHTTSINQGKNVFKRCAKVTDSLKSIRVGVLANS